MNMQKKKEILSYLAKKADPESQSFQAIQKECENINNVLTIETQYDLIADQLENLSAISYRLPDEAISIINNLLMRLEDIELTYQEVPGFSAQEMSGYLNNSKLIIKSLEILEEIRYHRMLPILDILFEYSCHKEPGVAKQAIHGIKLISRYDLDIYYGDGKEWEGWGWHPQEVVLEKISSLDEQQKINYFDAVIKACNELLSPSITGTKAFYNKVNWESAPMPVTEGIKLLRDSVLNELKKVFKIVADVNKKISVIRTMLLSTQTPNLGKYSDDVEQMIMSDAKTVSLFLLSIVDSVDFQIRQEIEHEAYWVLYRKGLKDRELLETAKAIRDKIYSNGEYQIFRILIGYNSIYHEWNSSDNIEKKYEYEKEYREKETIKLANSVNTDNYLEWKERIIDYASIESNDLATFPYFVKFLEQLGSISPNVALDLLEEESDCLGGFVTSLLLGAASTNKNQDVLNLIDRWCEQGDYLYYIARFFEYYTDLNEKILKKLLDNAIKQEELAVLNQLIVIISIHYDNDKHHMIEEFFFPVLDELTKHKDTRWIHGIWFKKERLKVLCEMDEEGQRKVLNNLRWLKEIDYHAEEVMCVIAEQRPELVLQYFCDRLDMDIGVADKYNAIPFKFHRLSKPLSNHPRAVIEIVKQNYSGNYGLFVFNGAKLISIIFENITEELQCKLIKLLSTEKESDILFVMAILQNYDGNVMILPICKAIVPIISNNKKLQTELIEIMQNTGVVSGEYGFVNAYKQKIKEIQPWVKDSNNSIQEFSSNYIESLHKKIEYETKRANESISLRKHEYGVDDDKK